jgi:hypothetical protein
LSLSTAFGSIAVRVFAHDDRKAYLSFRVVIICGHVTVQKEYEQFIAMFGQTLGQPFAVLIQIGGAKDVCQPHVKVGNALLVFALSELIPVDDQLDRFVHQTFETPCKERPLLGAIPQRHLLDLAQQMDDTLLLGERLDAVVGAEEVGDQDSFEKGTEHFLHHRTGPGGRQYVIGQNLARKAPDPGGAAAYAPAAFICVEDGREPCGFAQILIDGHKQFIVALELFDALSLPFEESGKMARGSTSGKEVPKCLSCGLT